jgi:predicted DNA binding CopG/RHH family protein
LTHSRDQLGAIGRRSDARTTIKVKRVPQTLLNALKDCATKRGIPYQSFIRKALAQAVTRK